MERYKKIVLCSTLNKEMKATFFVKDVFGSNGNFKKKAVEFYNCEGKEKCGVDLVIDCSCFRELFKVESEINSTNHV